MPPGKGHIEIAYVGISFAPGDVLRYQYRLEGGDGAQSYQEWSLLTPQRSVIYPRLPSGNYTFHVRAIGADGSPSASPATVHFRILSPFWKRWWFLALMGGLAGTIIFTIHRFRMEQLLKIERLRNRLAADLHDEIGSGLSQIAVLTEVARKQVHASSGDAAAPIGRVAEISRDLLDSMNDIVWAINVHRDRLDDLTSRMRRFAHEMLASSSIDLEFVASGLIGDTRIDTDKRRQIYLIFRESIRNLVRHSACRKAAVRLSSADGDFVMEISDNGVGFDAQSPQSGDGMRSLRERARSIGGRIEWLSEMGTKVTLRVPLPK